MYIQAALPLSAEVLFKGKLKEVALAPTAVSVDQARLGYPAIGRQQQPSRDYGRPQVTSHSLRWTTVQGHP